MNLTLEALKKGKQKCVDISGLDAAMSINERNEIHESIISLQSSFDQCIQVIDKIEEVKASLEKFGYTDEWYDTVFATSGLENLVEFDIPKLTTYGVKGEACLEGFVDTIRTWIFKAWNFIKSAIEKIYRFIIWLAKKVGLDTTRKCENLQQAMKDVDHVVTGMAEDQLKEATGIDIETFYDIDPLNIQLANVFELLQAISSDKNEEEVVAKVQENKLFTPAETVRTLWLDNVKAALDAANVDYTHNLEKTGYILKFQSNSNKMFYFFGKATGKQFKQTKLAIDDIDQVRETVAKVCDFGKKIGDLINLYDSIGQIIKTKEADLQKEVQRLQTAGASPTADTNGYYSLCHARLIATSCQMEVIAAGMMYLSEVNNGPFNVNLEMAKRMLAVIEEAAKQKPTA